MRKSLLGWQSVWDEEKFLQSTDDEILAIEQLDTSRSSLFDKLHSTDAKVYVSSKSIDEQYVG